MDHSQQWLQPNEAAHPLATDINAAFMTADSNAGPTMANHTPAESVQQAEPVYSTPQQPAIAAAPPAQPTAPSDRLQETTIDHSAAADASREQQSPVELPPHEAGQAAPAGNAAAEASGNDSPMPDEIAESSTPVEEQQETVQPMEVDQAAPESIPAEAATGVEEHRSDDHGMPLAEGRSDQHTAAGVGAALVGAPEQPKEQPMDAQVDADESAKEQEAAGSSQRGTAAPAGGSGGAQAAGAHGEAMVVPQSVEQGSQELGDHPGEAHGVAEEGLGGHESAKHEETPAADFASPAAAVATPRVSLFNHTPRNCLRACW